MLKDEVLKRKSHIKNEEKLFDNDENKRTTNFNVDRKTIHEFNNNKQKTKNNKTSKGYKDLPLKSSLTKRKNETEVKFDTRFNSFECS